MSALRTLYETFEGASLHNYGWGAEGAAALESDLMLMVRVAPAPALAESALVPQEMRGGKA